MRVRAGSTVRRAGEVALLAALLAGCGGDGGSDAKPSARASADRSAAARAASGVFVGPEDSACPLPVTFEVARKWEPKAIEAEESPEGSGDSGAGEDVDDFEKELREELLGSLLTQGPVTAACEINARPAGRVGFLRVWTGEPGDGDARSVLEGFVAAENEPGEERYREFTGNGLDGVEVEYLTTSALLDETRKHRAFAVTTPSGPVVVHLGGVDAREHDRMLPAFELARSTVKRS
jgi:hypothetical protein